MKPEIRVALVREAERAKNSLVNEHPGRWIRLGYFGSAVTTLMGAGLFTTAVAYIAENRATMTHEFLGTMLILAALLLIAAPGISSCAPYSTGKCSSSRKPYWR